MVLSDFFKLPGHQTHIDQAAFLNLLAAGGKIESLIYDPRTLVNPEPPKRFRVQNCEFVEVSLSNTLIERFEFADCTFTSCLFIGTIFKDCRFTGCAFIDCNTYRIEFLDAYISPQSFAQCLDRRRHQNIGVHLYQELLNNSRRQSQPDFAQDALFLFRRWLRFETIYTLRQPTATWGYRFRAGAHVALSWMAEIFFGYGVRLGSYLRTAFLVALTLAAMNYFCIAEFGLKIDRHASEPFIDALYFTIITLTTVGYGDITPVAPLGRVVVSGEAVVGFFLLAILASMIYRKIQP